MTLFFPKMCVTKSLMSAFAVAMAMLRQMAANVLSRVLPVLRMETTA